MSSSARLLEAKVVGRPDIPTTHLNDHRNFGGVPCTFDIAGLKSIMSSIDYVSVDEKRSFAPQLLSQLRTIGLFSLSAPVYLGGRDADMAMIADVIQHLAYYDLSTAVLVSLHNLLAAPALYDNRPNCLTVPEMARVAPGEDLVAYGLAEMSAGSDPRRIIASACFGYKGARIKLDGQKCWTGLGAWSTYTLFLRKP